MEKDKKITIKLNMGIVLNNNDHTLITKIRKDRFGWASYRTRDINNVEYRGVEQRQGAYVYGFYKYIYKDPKDILLNFTPENMMFYSRATDTHFNDYLAQFGVSYLTKIKWDPKMAPSVIYQGGYFPDNISYAVSEHGELYEPADRVKHWSHTGSGSFAMFCAPLEEFCNKNDAPDLDTLLKNIENGKALRYNPKDYEGLNY
jgi:hypothetical protein